MLLPATRAAAVRLATGGLNRKHLALFIGATAAQQLGVLSIDALREAAARAPAGIAEENLAVLEKSAALAATLR